MMDQLWIHYRWFKVDLVKGFRGKQESTEIPELLLQYKLKRVARHGDAYLQS